MLTVLSQRPPQLTANTTKKTVSCGDQALPEKVAKSLFKAWSDPGLQDKALRVLLPLEQAVALTRHEQAGLKAQALSVALLAYGECSASPSGEGRQKLVHESIEAIMEWPAKTCQYICDLRQGSIRLCNWLSEPLVLQRLGMPVCSRARASVLDADAYGFVWQTAFSAGAIRRLGYRSTTGGWWRYSSDALQGNDRVLSSLLHMYLDAPLAGRQHHFDLIDWMRACLLICVMWQGLTVFARDCPAHVRRVVDIVWDVACVAGQLPVSRGGRGSAGEGSPEQQRTAIVGAYEQGKKEGRYSDSMRSRDTRKETRDQACRLLSALVVQRIEACEAVRSKALKRAAAARLAVDQGSVQPAASGAEAGVVATAGPSAASGQPGPVPGAGSQGDEASPPDAEEFGLDASMPDIDIEWPSKAQAYETLPLPHLCNWVEKAAARHPLPAAAPGAAPGSGRFGPGNLVSPPPESATGSPGSPATMTVARDPPTSARAMVASTPASRLGLGSAAPDGAGNAPGLLPELATPTRGSMPWIDHNPVGVGSGVPTIAAAGEYSDPLSHPAAPRLVGVS